MPDEATLLHDLYPASLLEDKEYLYSACVLSPLNKKAEEVNLKVSESNCLSSPKLCSLQVLGAMKGEARTYLSIDSPIEGTGLQCAPEFFHDMMPSGMPPHCLKLKVRLLSWIYSLFSSEGRDRDLAAKP